LAPNHPNQLALLEWQPPAPVSRFADDQVRAVTIANKLCRAISVALVESALPREEIAARMSDYLGTRISVNMLNAYASQGREDHVINVPRFMALLHATGDKRLLQLLAESFGWVVLERKYLTLIELASVQEREEALRRQGKKLRDAARAGGLL
jgi:hypothetical protein